MAAILRLLLAAAVIGVLVYVFDFDDWRRILDVEPAWIGLGLAFSLAANLLAASRWQHALSAFQPGHSLRLRDVFYIVCMLNTVSAFGIGTAAGVALRPVVLATNHGIPLKESTYSVLLDRSMDLMVMAIVLLPTVVYLAGAMDLAHTVLLILVASFIALILLFFFPSPARWYMAAGFRILDRGALRLWRRVRKPKFATKTDSTAAAIGFPAAHSFSPAYLFLLSLLRVMFLVLRAYAIAVALGYQLPLGLILVGTGINLLSVAVSPTPEGLGVAEAGWVAVFAHFGLPMDAGLILSLGFRGYVWLYVLAAIALATVWIKMNAPKRRPAERESSGADV